MESKFNIGDKVTAIALPEAIPYARPAVTGLTVTSIRLIECATMQPYYRVEAHDNTGFGYIEGAERFFERE